MFSKSYGLRVPSSPCPLFSRYNVPQFSMFPVGPTFAGSSVLMVPGPFVAKFLCF